MVKHFLSNPNMRFVKIRDSGRISNPNLISKKNSSDIESESKKNCA